MEEKGTDIHNIFMRLLHSGVRKIFLAIKSAFNQTNTENIIETGIEIIRPDKSQESFLFIAAANLDIAVCIPFEHNAAEIPITGITSWISPIPIEPIHWVAITL